MVSRVGVRVSKEYKIFLWVFLVGIGLIIILKFLFPLMAPFLLGTIFACLIEPFVKKLHQRFKIDRKLVIILILLFVVILALSITGFSLIAFYQETQRIIPRIPEMVGRILRLTGDSTQHLAKYFPQFKEFGANFGIPGESIVEVLRSIILGGIQILPRFPQLILALGLGGVTAYFLSRDKDRISELFYRFLPSKWQRATQKLKIEVMDSVARFIRVECILALITTAITTLFFIILGKPAAPAYGLLAGILDFLPVLGPGMVYITLAVIDLLFGNYLQALWVFFAYFLLLLLRQVTEYKLIGENLNLHPLISIVVVYIGVEIFGFAGIFFGPLLIIILRSVYRIMKAVDG
jgi:sporulation integral membrane protein YtvI